MSGPREISSWRTADRSLSGRRPTRLPRSDQRDVLPARHRLPLTAMTEVPQISRPIHVPDKPALEGLETKWQQRWEAEHTYAFDRSRPRSDVYAIDTPPPTVSGSLHVGHVFS